VREGLQTGMNSESELCPVAVFEGLTGNAIPSTSKCWRAIRRAVVAADGYTRGVDGAGLGQLQAADQTASTAVTKG
jgi:hypothetical protein